MKVFDMRSPWPSSHLGMAVLLFPSVNQELWLLIFVALTIILVLIKNSLLIH